ncbi:LppP/LprE family lipoprotein [Mycobacteroides abscessus]|uniref:LppP/LprE family lipoprotein n=1 Tax=Mycobacteroides abscessus TaxID=36809 RepID=UPI0009A674A1|nr:LppP/LprE family lipoprotein [Mycobacteroides abscessus]SKH88179.1 lipoprotein LppP [Mycobacteroides abscessus subsp. massiliense]SKH92132.1 lipoprotein LppP [Mycobacteroides abscessus subsp. massiliense]SKI12628.1 lipoprotein LppP [Mycobacteroides abscessus subsp. massiliense]SKK21405.1 lipoprotein LppP [Mycobacteroides abscessus subsp. massiliense]SKK31796.1 lipoprotein LppP [Mycobacteroides abscessus subsp. massiliense]
MNSQAGQHFPTAADIEKALTALPRCHDELAWVAADRGQSAAGGLTWVRAIIERGSTSSPEHVLFFAGRGFLGTATPDPHPFTQVVSTDGDTVTVQYRWLVGEEPNSAPGGVGAVRYQLTHRDNGEPAMTALDEAPYPPLEEFFA